MKKKDKGPKTGNTENSYFLAKDEKKKNFRKRVVLDLRGGMEWCLEVKRKL